MQKKLYHLKTHFFVSGLDLKTGICQLGFTDYVLKHFLRFNKISNEDYPKTVYGMSYTTLISLFLRETFKKYEQQILLKQKLKLQGGDLTGAQTPNLLTASQKMQYSRFLIKRGEPFSLLKTYEYDVQLSAPFDMRVIDLNHEVYYFDRFLTTPYVFDVQCLNMAQLENLVTEEQYSKAAKFFQYC